MKNREIIQGDIGVSLDFTIIDNGSPVDLTDASIEMILDLRNEVDIKDGEIIDAKSGTCRVVLNELDTSIKGTRTFQLSINFPDGRRITCPIQRFDVIQKIGYKPPKLDTTPPEDVTFLAVTNITNESVTLAWTRSISKDTASYEIFNGTEKIASTKNSYCKITNLSSSSDYTFTIIAKDDFKNLSNGVNISIRTLATPSEINGGNFLDVFDEANFIDGGSFTDTATVIIDGGNFV